MNFLLELESFYVFVSFVLSYIWQVFLYKSGSLVLKFTSIQSKSRSNQRCDLADRSWNFNLASFYFYFIQWILNPFGVALRLVHIILVPLPFDLCYSYPKWDTLSFIFIILALLYKIIWKIIFEIILLCNLIDWPPFYCVYFVSYFIYVDLININFPCLFICLCIFFFLKIHWDGFIKIYLFSYRQIVGF